MTGMISQRVRVRGLVQGVGFRPYVWHLARELALAGWVRNDAEGVAIEIHGDSAAVASFLRRLPREIPPLARIDSLEVQTAEPADCNGFAILDSQAGPVTTAIGPDAALCPACLADLCDPAGRRWRYPFTTCTHCGPRYTVSRGIPYDRTRTSLAGFTLCPPCAAEYADPADRRFHAETTACPACGPRLWLEDGAGQAVAGDPIVQTLALLRSGAIVAIKGLGGFHLACDARNPGAVAELRQRKQREAKPFAVMGLNAASFAGVAVLGPAETALLASPEAPIVLCPKVGTDLPGVAPDLAWLGCLLPTTPLHLLLWHEAAGRPAGTAWTQAANELLLVMTSANPNGEPLVIGNDEARQRLAGIADAFLVHDREIVVRCDDSVVHATAAGPAFLRRSRGYTPRPIALAEDGPAVLAFGAFLKNTVCLTRGREAFLSQHIGGLDNPAAIAFQEEAVAHLTAILAVTPEVVAHDLHPDYPSSRLAVSYAAERGIPAIAVAHHQAHLAALAGEYGITGPLLGLAVDGVGLGPDGGLWGGELLEIEGTACRRLGHLRPLALPGGDRAAREPWRMAVSALHALGRSNQVDEFLARRHPGKEGRILLEMLDRQLNCPATSSLGRLFDAAAGLLGICGNNRYEGEAAMALEGQAARHGPVPALADGYRIDPSGQLDFLPLLAALADSALTAQAAAHGAALFHATVAAGLAAWATASAEARGHTRVALTGGCAMNRILATALAARLTTRGITLLQARQAPPNDGGLALGQAVVARRMMKEKY